MAIPPPEEARFSRNEQSVTRGLLKRQLNIPGPMLPLNVQSAIWGLLKKSLIIPAPVLPLKAHFVTVGLLLERNIPAPGS